MVRLSDFAYFAAIMCAISPIQLPSNPFELTAQRRDLTYDLREFDIKVSLLMLTRRLEHRKNMIELIRTLPTPITCFQTPLISTLSLTKFVTVVLTTPTVPILFLFYMTCLIYSIHHQSSALPVALFPTWIP